MRDGSVATRDALLLSTCADLLELDALARHPLLRCFGRPGSGNARLAWAVHAVPATLAEPTSRYVQWADGLAGVEHFLMRADRMPQEATASLVGRAFATSAHQRAMMRALLGPCAYPSAGELGDSLPVCQALQPIAGSGLAAKAQNGGDGWTRAEPLMVLGGVPGDGSALDAPRGSLDGSQIEVQADDGASSVAGEPRHAGARRYDAVTIADELKSVLAYGGGAATEEEEGGRGEQRGGEQQHTNCAEGADGAHATAPPPHLLAPWPRNELLICMLGTGCAVPSKHRAPAAVYLHAFSRGGLLLDAGEGTLGQLCALLGPTHAAEALRRLSVIWISHHHGDHHLGLLRLLAAVSELRPASEPPILVVGPRVVGAFLSAYMALPAPPAPSSAAQHPPPHGHLAPCGLLVPPQLPQQQSGRRPQLRFTFESCASLNGVRSPAREWLLRRSGLGLRNIRCVPVVHCSDAWGLVVEHTHGWSVVYSGDTRPCDKLVAAGRGATLLIHEATFDDERVDDAKLKRHSTRGEALEVASRMGAYRTILTHLSQRYREMHENKSQPPPQPPKPLTGTGDEAEPMALCEEEGGGGAASGDATTAGGASASGMNTNGVEAAVEDTSVVAFDLMAINLADLDKLPSFTRPLAHFFACDHLRQRAEREAEAAAALSRSKRLEREAEAALRARRMEAQASLGALP